MDYTFMPSLELLALTRIATILWNQNVRSLLVNLNRSILNRYDYHVCCVMEKVLQLLQPGPLRLKILGLIKPIGVQIFKWMHNHIYIYPDKNLPNDLCWTPQGTIDEKRTAEVLIKDENLDICSRYKIACTLCFEDDIPELWNEIPKKDQRLFYLKRDPKRIKQHELVVVWTYGMMGELPKLNKRIEDYWGELCSPYQHAFRRAIFDANETAIGHFLRKLTPPEREESLVKFTGYLIKRHVHYVAPSFSCADILCFLLSQMNEQQQGEVFKKYSYEVLHCFLNWPCQEFFMETSKHVWTFLTEANFYTLLLSIVRKATIDYKDYDYQKILKEFWQQSPINHRKYVIDFLDSSSLLSHLFKIDDKENIKLILKDATTAEREKFIFSVQGKCLFEYLLCNGKSDLLKFFIQDYISCKSNMIKLKGEFAKHVVDSMSSGRLHRENDLWNKFSQLLDELTEKDVK